MSPSRTKLGTFERLEYRRLQAIIRRVRNRWRLKVLLRGLALLLAAGVVGLSLAAWGADLFRARPWIVGGLSVVTYGMLGWLLFRFVVRPLSRRISDRDVALYIEKRAPELRASLVSAVEFGEAGRTGEGRSEVSARFVEKVVEQALAKGPEIDFGKGVERQDLRRVSRYLGAATTAVVVILLVNPAFLRHGVPLLINPWGAGGEEVVYGVSVAPGDAEIARGGDQLVTASLAGFDSDRVEISLRVGDADWERLPMTAAEEGGYEFLLTRLQEPAEYFVEASGVRSPVYRLDVVDVPYVERIQMELEYPEYSGLEPELVEDGGDIAALPGTRVRLRIHPTVQVPGGRLRLEYPDGEPAEATLPLETGEAALTGELVLERPGYYRVELEGFDGGFSEASSEYVIDLLDDQPPVISLDAPGRDLQATSIEEVFTEVSAEDDYGLASVELVYTVNGGEAQTIPLIDPGDDPPTDTTGAYTFYLEEWTLEPGDFISYWARATDVRGQAAGAERATDIYFIQVRPFDQQFRQAPQGGGGGGGGGGGTQFELSRRQREIIAATFKIQRDREILAPERVAEDLELLEELQAGLREQTLRASEQARQMQGSGDTVSGMRALSRAADEMETAVAELDERDAAGALPPEQRALQQLQRFEALVREMMVSMGGGAGGGGQQSMEGMEDLFQIDPSELRNQYEAVQRQRQQQADDAVDEALQRLTELARRQQQELERQRARSRTSQGGGGGASQREIADQAEELARQLERLSRDRSDRELQEAANRLQEAADAMRRSAASDSERGSAEATRALNELQNARRLLDEERGGRLERDLADARARIDRLRAAQQRMEEQVGDLGTPGGRTPQRMDRILEDKDRITEEIRELERQLDDMARASRGDQMRASRGLQEAAEFIRDSKLADKVRYSKGVVQERDTGYARRFEEDISRDLADLEGMIDAAGSQVERSEGERLASALDDTRDLVRRLESFEERVDGRQDGDPSDSGDAGEIPGRLGEPGEDSGSSDESGGERGEGDGGEGDRPGEQSGAREGRAPASGAEAGARGRLGGNVSGVPGPRQLGREFDERIRDAEELRERLQQEGVQTTDLDRVIGAMRDFDESFDGTERGLDELRREVIDGLKLFEFRLRRVTEAATGRRPQLTSSDAVPEGYRELVEEYFRALAGDGGEESRE